MTTRERKAAMKQIPCPACSRPMPAGRRAANMLSLTGGVCGQCSHTQRAEAKVERPMYETDAWARGVRL